MKGNNKFMSLSAGLALAIVAITTSVAGADDQVLKFAFFAKLSSLYS